MPINGSKNKVGFGILFIFIALILLLGVLNYFNILRLSEIFPQLGFLPRREVPTDTSQQFNNVTISPSDQAKQTLTSFLPTILTPSFPPKSPFDIALTEDREDKEKLNASWNIKGGGTAWAVFPKLSNSQKITSLDIFFEKIQTASPSVELAKSGVKQVFSTELKGTWVCAQIAQRTSYCENFWEEEKSGKKLGIGLTGTDPLSPTKILTTFFCQYSKGSRLYAWKSCASEFSDTGVQ